MNKELINRKAERQGWMSCTNTKTSRVSSVVGEGKRVERGTYFNPSVKTRTLVP